MLLQCLRLFSFFSLLLCLHFTVSYYLFVCTLKKTLNVAYLFIKIRLGILSRRVYSHVSCMLVCQHSLFWNYYKAGLELRLTGMSSVVGCPKPGHLDSLT